MTEKLSKALESVEIAYADLVEIANNMTGSIFKPANDLIKTLDTKLTAMSIDMIRDYMLQLQLQAFTISDIKEKSSLKAELAEALQKEAFAISFNGMDGSAAVKEKLALVETSEQVIVEALYNLVAGLFRAKLDQLHRLVDVLKSVLMSRMQEMRLSATSPAE